MLSLRRRPVQTCDGKRSCNTLLDKGEPELQTGQLPPARTDKPGTGMALAAAGSDGVRFYKENKINKLRRTVVCTHTV
jgi:hypothetical protein